MLSQWMEWVMWLTQFLKQLECSQVSWSIFLRSCQASNLVFITLDFQSVSLDDTFIKTIMTLIMMIIPETDSFVALGKNGLLLIYESWCSVKMESSPIHSAPAHPWVQLLNLIYVVASRKVESHNAFCFAFPLAPHLPAITFYYFSLGDILNSS